MVLVRRDFGQASVECVVAIPLVVVVLLAGWQLVVAGQTWWKTHEVARLAARARYVAEQAGDPSRGLRRSRELTRALLSDSPARSRSVRFESGGRVAVDARVPLVEPFRSALGASRGPLVSATARLRP